MDERTKAAGLGVIGGALGIVALTGLVKEMPAMTPQQYAELGGSVEGLHRATIQDAGMRKAAGGGRDQQRTIPWRCRTGVLLP